MKTHRVKLALAVVAAAILTAAPHRPALAFESGRASFSVAVNTDLVIPYRVFAVYVLPREVLRLEGDGSKVIAGGGDLIALTTSVWQWVAPAEPGATTLIFERPDDSIRINVFVLHPASGLVDGRLNGYSIGGYPEPLRGDPVYAAPDGYIELTAATASLELSPHLRLNQFPSKQAGGMPKYLVLRESLLLKLELLLEHVNASGIPTDSLTVMSGFRTPGYNRAIGNGQHSRHIYGGAADVYIDVAPRDGIMDDLNGDGALDYRDAQHLYRLADEFFGRTEHRSLRGGLGVYRSTPAHGPFLHVDARGFRARWGLLP